MGEQKREKLDEMVETLRQRLAPEGWTVYRSRHAVKAHWRWFRLTLRYKPGQDPHSPWRARLRDRFPRMLITEARGQTPDEALRPVLAHARHATHFCEGRLGLVVNPSKSWLAHRVFCAVHRRP